jgi:hypothetical protein
MTQEIFDRQYKGKQFRCLADTKIKYTHQLGGGIRSNARTVKYNDIITVAGFSRDIDTVSIATIETVSRIDKSFFDTIFTPINLAELYNLNNMSLIPLTPAIIKTTIDQFKSIACDIHIATHSSGNNRVEMMYNTNYKVYTITSAGVPYYATNRKKAIELFNNELHKPN